MTHEREFTTTDESPAREAAKARRLAEAGRMAKAYARLFATEDGGTVLADLRAKFGHERPRFDVSDRHHSTVTAAITDGECNVLREIETAMRAGSNNNTNHNNNGPLG